MAAWLTEHAAAAGYDMHVHAVAAHGPSRVEHVDGVTVHLYRRSFRLRRAVFSLPLLWQVWRMRRSGGVAHVHMPYPESFILSWVLRRGWTFIATYQCDAPRGGFADNVIAGLLDWSHRRFIRRAAVTVCSSADYAGYSRLADDISKHGLAVVPVTGHDRAGGKPTYAVTGKRLIGFIGRPTYEKGINVLLEALDSYPDDDVALLFAGPQDGLTETVGYDVATMNRLIEGGRIIPIGFLDERDIADFYASCDVYVHPSINSFDAFGIVQIEAMSAGVPVVASDIPGVRTPVQATGFGEITRAGDADDLRRGLVKALTSTYSFASARAVLEEVYLAPQPQDAYLRLYEKVIGRSHV